MTALTTEDPPCRAVAVAVAAAVEAMAMGRIETQASELLTSLKKMMTYRGREELEVKKQEEIHVLSAAPGSEET